MQTETIDGKTLETWDPAEVKAALDKGEIVLIDVRTPQEYMIEHIEGSLLMPMSFFIPESLPTQDGKKIVFHCGSGMRSGNVAKRYLGAGNDSVAHMGGGMMGWKQAQLPHIAVDMSSGAPKSVNG